MKSFSVSPSTSCEIILPMNKCSLSIHKVKLVIKSCPSFSNSSCVREHADSSGNLSKVPTRNHSWRLVVDTDLETSWTPIHKLDAPLGLDGGNSSVDILGNDITTEEQTASHVLAMTRITLDHLVSRLETCVGDFSNSKLFVVRLLG